MNINLEYYKIFYTVAKCNNISDAADKLFISQPAVSKSIKKLEEMLSIKLFYRKSRGVDLTKEGAYLLEYVEKALTSLNDGEKLIDKLKTRETGNIKIGVSTTLGKHYLVPRLKNFISLYPNIKIIIINKSAQETLKLIENNIIDIGIVSNLVSYEKFNYKRLYEIHDIFVSGPEFSEYKNINTFNDLTKLSSLILLEKHNISRMYLDSFFKINSVELNPTMEIDNMDLLIELTKLNLGVSCTIEEFVSKEVKTCALVKIDSLPTLPKRHIIMISNKNFSLSLAAQSFWDCLSNNCFNFLI